MKEANIGGVGSRSWLEGLERAGNEHAQKRYIDNAQKSKWSIALAVSTT
jgi:hypothetical protein